MVACPECGRENAADARFCSACGAEIVTAPARETRKTVTVLFSDVAGSTALGERLDPESLRRVVSRYFDAMAAVVERHGGTVEKFIGDAIMAVFGIPQLREDDALRAVRAAAQMRDRLAELNEELERAYTVRIENRTGINTGEVVAGDPSAGQRLVTGDAVNVAARLEQAASAGEILIGASTFELVRDAVRVERVEPVAAKGKAEPVVAHRLVDVLADVPAFARRLDTPFVGRERELAALNDAFARAAAERTCQLVTVLGPAGIGKSRLLHQFLAHAGARIVVGRCLPYGEGITYWPLVEIVKQIAGSDARAGLQELLGEDEHASLVAARLATAVGQSDEPSSAEETFWAARKLLEALAAEQPVVAVVDDVHWAQPTFLDLIEYVLGFSSGAPLLLLCGARPDLLEERPSWANPRPNAVTVLLEPLDDGDSEALVHTLLGGAEVDSDAQKRILAAAEGNPLFVEQMLALHRDRAGSDTSVPPTIQALLAARIDHLDPDERTVIERGAVEGRLFHRAAVAELAPPAVRPAVATHLLGLVRKELIRPDRSEFPADDGFRFGHILIRDAAYAAMPKELRAELHERYAAWLERVAASRREYDEISAYHLEQAYLHRAELGPIDDETEALGHRAAAQLAGAARRAHERTDDAAAANLAERAVRMLPPGSSERLSLLPELGRSLVAIGEFETAAEVLSEAREGAEATRDDVVRWRARVEQAFLEGLIHPHGWVDRVSEEVPEAIVCFERAGDDRGLIRAETLRGVITAMGGQGAAADAAWERAAELARACGDTAERARILVFVGGSALYGPVPVHEGIARHHQLLEELRGYRVQHAGVQAGLGALLAMSGDIEQGRALVSDSRAVVADLTSDIDMLSAWDHLEGLLDRCAGDHAAAAAAFRRASDRLAEVGERGYRSTQLAELADALWRTGDDQDAFELAAEAAALGSRDDAATQLLATVVQAKVLARRGEVDEAERLALRAVERAATTDFLDMQAAAWEAMAHVRRSRGESEAAVEAAAAAVRLHEQKGNAALAAQARALEEELRAGAAEGPV